jgi:hypothetical protein
VTVLWVHVAIGRLKKSNNESIQSEWLILHRISALPFTRQIRGVAKKLHYPIFGTPTNQVRISLIFFCTFLQFVFCTSTST